MGLLDITDNGKTLTSDDFPAEIHGLDFNPVLKTIDEKDNNFRKQMRCRMCPSKDPPAKTIAIS